jgi:hypothetical protein
VKESFLVAIGFVTKLQLKGLTNMFCVLMSTYKVYKEDVFSFGFFKLKIMCHLKWAQGSSTLKAKHKIKLKCLFAHFLTQLLLYHSTFLPICLPSYLGS